MDSSQPYPGRFYCSPVKATNSGRQPLARSCIQFRCFPRTSSRGRTSKKTASTPHFGALHASCTFYHPTAVIVFFILPLDPLLLPPSPTITVLLPCSRPKAKGNLSDPNPRRRQNNETRPGSAGLRLHRLHGSSVKYLSYCSHFPVWGTCSRPSIVIFVMRSLLSDHQKAYAW